MSSIRCDRWRHLKIKISCRLNVIKAGLLLKARPSRAVVDLARLGGWTAPRSAATQTKVLWEPASPVGIPRHLLGLWAWVGVWRNHTVLSDRKKCRTWPHQISVNATHITADTNWNLAPIKTIVRHIFTRTFLALREKRIGPELTGPQHR